ncbi:hypothetical protein KA111_02360 [Candidatus Woesebacteria bacterium]|nr:hypothetical protein [Candidatus Woesebacteria bacterium]
MAEEKPKFKFLRRIDDLKDIIGNSDAKAKVFYLKSLEKIVNTKGFFVDGTGPESFSISDGVIVAPANLISLQNGEINIDRNRYYSYIFPSEFVKALSDLAKIFVKKDQTLSQYTDEEETVKNWGDYRENNAVDETAYIKKINEIETLRRLIVDAFQKNPDLIKDTEDNVLPILSDEKQAEEGVDSDSQGDKNGDGSDSDKINTAVVPVAALQLTRADKVLQANDIAPEIKQKIQYETGWLYNRAVYEMFTAHGIDKNDIDPNVLEKLRLDVFDFTSQMDEKQLFAMLGSASQRQTALLRFYPKFASQNRGVLEEYYKKLTGSPAFQNLDQKQKEEFNQFNDNLLGGNISKLTSPIELLKQSLMVALGSDSAKLNKNVQNTLDAMILQYGIDQEYFAQDENGQVILVKGNKNKHDVINILKNMDDEKIKIIFDLPGSTTSKEIRQLKEVLYSYTTYRASELTLHVMDTSLSRGLIKVSDDEAKKLAIKGSGTEAIHRDVLTNTRSAIEENGAETVAGGLDSKNENSRKKDKINKITKQYKTFLPLWANLSAEEQRIVYNQFNLPFQQGNKDAGLEFIPEFLFFDISTLNTFKNIKNAEKMTADQQAEALKLYELLDREQLIKDVEELQSLDFIALGNQIADEKKYGQFLQDSYIYNTELEKQLLMADFVNDGASIEDQVTYVSSGAGNTNPSINNGFFNKHSPRELMEFDQHIIDSDYNFSQPNQQFSKYGGVSSRIKNSKIYKGLTKRFGGDKLNPAKKMAGSLGKSAASKTFVNVAKAANLALPGGAVLNKIYDFGNKVGFKNASFIIGGLLTALVAQTIRALSTVGGFIGGALGGTVGFIVAGGPVGIIPGVIVGSNAGFMVNSTPLVNSIFGNNGGLPATEAAMANSSANTAALKIAGKEALLGATADVFFGVPIAILAPGMAMFIGIVVTIHAIFTIQSAFLIPVPTGLSSMGGGLILGDLACFQLMPGGDSQTIVLESGESVTLTSLDWDQASIDLVKGGLDEVANNGKFIELLCGDGPIALYKYPPSPQGYYGWTRDSNNFILYGGAFQNVAQMEYLMIHESVHILEGRNPGIVDGFSKNLTTSDCFTYPVKASCVADNSEAFAEAVVLYMTSDRFVGNIKYPAGPWPFKQNYRKTYDWIKEEIFGGQEYQ